VRLTDFCQQWASGCVIELYHGGVVCSWQLTLGGTDLCIHVHDCFSTVNQRPDLGPAVHCEPSRTSHDRRSPGGGVDGFRFAASRRVSFPSRDGCWNKDSFCISLGLFSVWLFSEFLINIPLPYDPSVLFLGIYWKDMKINVYKLTFIILFIYVNLVYKCPQLEAIPNTYQQECR